MDAAYALVVADLEKAGLDMQSAIFKTDEFLRLDRAAPALMEPSSDSGDAAQAAANDAALAELKGMLKGLM